MLISNKLLINLARIFAPLVILAFVIVYHQTHSAFETENVIVWIGYFIWGGLFAAGFITYRTWQMARWIANRVTRDVSHLQPSIPDTAKSYVEELGRLGLEYSGEIEASSGSKGKPAVAWQYVNSERTVWAYMTPAGKRWLIAFISVFADFSTLQTWYPRGSSAKRPHFRAIRVRRSIEHAYQKHREELKKMAVVMGEPMRMNTVLDPAIWTEEFAARYPTEGPIISAFRNSLFGVVYFGYLLIWLNAMQHIIYWEYGKRWEAHLFIGLLVLPILLLDMLGGKWIVNLTK